MAEFQSTTSLCICKGICVVFGGAGASLKPLEDGDVSLSLWLDFVREA